MTAAWVDFCLKATARLYIRGGNTNTNDPVNDPPIRAMTMSNRDTDSPTTTLRRTTADLMAHRFHPNAKYDNNVKVINVIFYKSIAQRFAYTNVKLYKLYDLYIRDIARRKIKSHSILRI